MFRTKEIIGNDRARFARAWERTFDNYGDRGGSEPNVAFDAWFEMIKIRNKKHLFREKIDNLPKLIKKKLNNLDQSQFGYSAFGFKNNTNFNYFEYPREIKKSIFKYVFKFLYIA